MSSVLVSSGPQEANMDAIGRVVDDLERYAGWLGNRTTAKRVRSDVQELRAIVEGGDFWELRESVQGLLLDVAQLSNTATRELIQKRISLLRNIATREPDEPTVGADRHAFDAS